VQQHQVSGAGGRSETAEQREGHPALAELQRQQLAPQLVRCLDDPVIGAQTDEKQRNLTPGPRGKGV
jgi:hypothetical protein